MLLFNLLNFNPTPGNGSCPCALVEPLQTIFRLTLQYPSSRGPSVSAIMYVSDPAERKENDKHAFTPFLNTLHSVPMLKLFLSCAQISDSPALPYSISLLHQGGQPSVSIDSLLGPH